MISQFVSPYPEQRLLGDLDFDFPEGTHAVGRLDNDSEGLLILTTDKTIVRRLLHPDRLHLRRYFVYVENVPSPETISQLCEGIDILVKKRGLYLTKSCDVKLLEKNPDIPERDPPFIEYRPHAWLEFNLVEGKNRQIRKMCKAVRHECKRLVRVSIEDLDLTGMKPGDVREMQEDEFIAKLKL